MVYFKHSELVNDYHVSLKTIHNWIDAAKQGKLDLQLHEQNGRTYIANTPGNLIALEQLADNGKKYRNTLHRKVVSPKAAFYELFSKRQILDIVTNLAIHREIPRQYNYFDGGASNWESFALHMWDDKGPNLLKSTVELIHANLSAIDLLLAEADKVNVIDIGPGNALPVRELLTHLQKEGKLHRYIAVDISESMLHIAEQNIQEWFGGSVNFEGYVKDVTYERFDDLVVDDMLNEGGDRTVNLALLLGATPMNFREPYDMLKVIRKSLGSDDLLIYTDKPDSEAERRSFGVNAEPGPGARALSSKYSLIFDLLNIDESLYDVEMGYNELNRERYIRVRLKTALTIKFKFKDGQREVNLEKGESILLWRVWHRTSVELIHDFEEIGLTLQHSSLTKNREYLLTISAVASDSAGSLGA
jgi:hypothetical protein